MIEDLIIEMAGKRNTLLTILHIGKDGVYIEPNRDELTESQDNYLLAVAFVYGTLHERGFIPTMEEIENCAYNLYTLLREGKYDQLKTINQMSNEEFNKWIKNQEEK